jgi:hypothetical protein
MLIVTLLFFCYAAGLKGGPADMTAPDDSSWIELMSTLGAKVPEGKKISELFGPLPGETTLSRVGALTPARFMEKYRASDDWTRLVMKRFARARLRELGRRGALNRDAVDAALGPEPAGVAGSRFFGIVEIPQESYHALISYIEFAAQSVPGSAYKPSEENRKKIDRALQVSLAISSMEGRLQYRDFDVVWSDLLMKLSCAGKAGEGALGPGILWLYAQVRAPAGLEFLPALPPDLQKKVDQEGGRLFTSAREASRNMPPSLAALTQWRCGD